MLQGFAGHQHETDPEYIQSLIVRAEQDMHWVLRRHARQ